MPLRLTAKAAFPAALLRKPSFLNHPLLQRAANRFEPAFAVCRRRSGWLLPCAEGAVSGTVLWAALHPIATVWDFDGAALTGIAAMLAVLFAVGFSVSPRLVRQSGGFSLFVAPAIAGLLIAQPLLISAATLLIPLFSPAALQSPSLRFALAALTVTIGFGFPVCLGGALLRRAFSERFAGRMIVGLGSGVLLAVLVCAPALGFQKTLALIALLIVGRWFLQMTRNRRNEGMTGGTLSDESDRSTDLQPRFVALLPVAAVTGAGFSLQSRALSQLSPAAGFLSAAELAGLLLGLAVGGSVARLLISRRTVSDVLGGAVCAIALAALPVLFPQMVNLQLAANAGITSPLLLTLFRVITFAAFPFLLAAGFGMLSQRLTRRPQWLAALLVIAVAGWATCEWCEVGGIPLATRLLLTGFAVCISGLFLFDRERFSSQPARLSGCGIIAAVCLVSAVPADRFDPAYSARLLFNTDVFLARQMQLPPGLLPFLDESRLLETAVGPRGLTTVWKQRGELIHVRRDGIPGGSFCVTPSRCPQITGELMRVLMPLCLHESAESLLLLGDPSGSGLATAARFPLQEIVCYDSDLTGQNSIATLEPQSAAAAVRQDSRITCRALSPRLAMTAEKKRYDVIVSDPGIPSLTSASSQLTRSFYAAAHRRLNADGLFCQRLRYADFGPELLGDLAATARTVFTQVVAIETGPGEFILLAKSGNQPIGDSGLLERLQRPHARALLAEQGWDYCVPLNLLMLEDQALQTLTASSPEIATDVSGRLAYRLPQEVMRWGSKADELRAAIASSGSRLFDRGVPERDQENVLTRIAEVVGQRRLMTRFPDQPWAYRKEVRNKLQEQPRSEILPVSGEIKRVMHPDDKRRLRYFELLGETVREPDAKNRARLSSLAEPYDPLVTYFLHHELASICAGIESARAEELEHRLHAIYFADSADQSVRNVAAALELLAAHPELITDEAKRFDHVNSLVQVLLGRWRMRGMTEPRSPEIVLNDLEKSLQAIDQAEEALAELAPSAGFDEAEWAARQSAIDRTLTRPLQSYRGALLAHMREKQAVEAAAKSKFSKTAESVPKQGQLLPR